MKLPIRIFTVLLANLAVAVTQSQAAVSIDYVSVVNPGNANDGTGYGAVGYVYNIGKYEVTVSQYAEFLNAVAKTDTYGLYNTSMGSDLNVSSITRSGLSGNYTYSVVGSGIRPIAYVNWFDAARFVNWLQNGQPVGSQVAGVTETGTYALNGATSGTGFTRASTGIYSLPSESEWYKAAYYQPVGLGGDADGYWLYPTASNSVPNSRNGSLSDANSGNFFRDDGLANGYNGGYAVNNSLTAPSGNALTDGGAFSLADSYYGTFDQGGNVWEWNDGVSGSSRIIRGGSWSGNESSLRATTRSTFFVANENSIVGFRVVVPEPGVTGMMMLGFALLAARMRRSR